MKLSEAMLVGARLHGQVFRNLAVDRGTCAWGAALEGAGMCYDVICSDPNLAFSERLDLWPWIVGCRRGWPCECLILNNDRDAATVSDIIVHLNDEHHWSREAIALWVQSVENELDVHTEGQRLAANDEPLSSEIGPGQSSVAVDEQLTSV